MVTELKNPFDGSSFDSTQGRVSEFKMSVEIAQTETEK